MSNLLKLVQELRDRTGAGMMDCKKALEACDSDIEKAIDWLRQKGIAKAASKGNRIAAEGTSTVLVDGNKAVIAEINSETDFTARNDRFLHAVKVVAEGLLHSDAKSLEEALKVETAEGPVSEVLSTISFATGEKMSLRRFELVEKTDDQHFGPYIHMGGKIAALAVVEGGSDEVAKDVAMQVASMNPTYIDRDHMPQEEVEHERSIQLEIAKNDPKNANKPEEIIAKMIEGRVSKALQDICLVDQIYFRDGQSKVSAFLKQSNAKVVKFIRYATGEGIEKKVDNWAEEVAAAVADLK
ncbi:MAG: elongation factor Ts [Erysipelotrichaceae bacterium]|nr:elongation factor Ts [Erysipelotrichaceae bacterium]